jgi:hypothetical protein
MHARRAKAGSHRRQDETHLGRRRGLVCLHHRGGGVLRSGQSRAGACGGGTVRVTMGRGGCGDGHTNHGSDVCFLP